MTGDERRQTVPPDGDGNVPWSTVVRLLAENAETKTNPTGLVPTAGRVAEDAADGTVYLGTGTEWLDADHDVGIDASGLPGVQIVRSADDLPDPSGGFHTLADGTSYLFTTEVESTNGLELTGRSPLLGWHREQSWFVRTDGGTAIKGDGDVLMNQMSVSAPGGTVFDVDATASEELIMNDVYVGVDDHLDASGTNIADLGTVGTFRGPEIRVAGMRDFDAGLTFDGAYNRMYLESKVRDVTASGVTVFTFASSFSSSSVDIINCDFASLQSDTVVFDIDAGATISEIFNYRGNTHDNSVTKSNVLTGDADPQTEPYWVSDSHPLRESGVVGELSLDSETETTISTQNEWTDIAGATSEGNETERMEQSANGVLKYIGSRDSNVHLTASVSFYGSNGDVYEFAIDKNDTVEPATAVRAEGKGQNANLVVSTSGIEDLVTNETVKLACRNTSGTNNLTVSAYTFNLLG